MFLLRLYLLSNLALASVCRRDVVQEARLKIAAKSLTD